MSALRLVRSFLLLEDDYEDDWEVSQGEHPHRRRARLERHQRRPGALAARAQVCSCPLPVRSKRQATTIGAGTKTGMDACQPTQDT